jgi:transcriptional regulator with PAS, ATPase and Fis domain
MIGTSQVIRDLREEIDRIARSDVKVLITGESGVGKEVVASEIVTGSLRASRPFVTVNCAGLPETLLESELFGHVRGSFTGAYRDQPGKLELANTGTLFLDEIGEMTLRMQGLLLRFLETGELQKIGSGEGHTHADVRVISATNRDLRQLIAQGLFREDLLYRLNVVHLHVPPLRSRTDDIPQLVEAIVTRLAPGGACSVCARSARLARPLRLARQRAPAPERAGTPGRRLAGRDHHVGAPARRDPDPVQDGRPPSSSGAARSPTTSSSG